MIRHHRKLLASNSHGKQTSSLLNQGRVFQSAIALGLVTVLMGACAESPLQTEAPADSTNVTTEEVAENTEDYVGQTVTVRSEPIDKVGDSSFTVSDEQFFGSEPILVINASGVPFTLPEEGGVEVQVTGEVRNFVVSDIDQEYNLGLDPAAYQEYENQPAIIAQSIALTPEPGEITQNPEQYYGETLAVTGEVEDIRNEGAFTLDEDKLLGAEDLLVVYATPKAETGQPQPSADLPAISDGETVAVTGVLRPFVVSEFERDYDLTWDLDVQRQLEAEYSNRPVLVATGVYPSAIPE